MSTELQPFLDQFCDWKAEQDDPVEFAWDERTLCFRLVIRDRPQPLRVALLNEFVVVDCPLGPITLETEPFALLRYSARNQMMSRLALVENQLVAEGSLPADIVTMESFDRLLRELGKVALDFFAPDHSWEEGTI